MQINDNTISYPSPHSLLGHLRRTIPLPHLLAALTSPKRYYRTRLSPASDRIMDTWLGDRPYTIYLLTAPILGAGRLNGKYSILRKSLGLFCWEN